MTLEKVRAELIRLVVIWALVLLFVDLLAYRSLYHDHPKFMPFRLDGILMRTDGEVVEVFNVKSGKWTSYSKMLEEVKK